MKTILLSKVTNNIKDKITGQETPFVVLTLLLKDADTKRYYVQDFWVKPESDLAKSEEDMVTDLFNPNLTDFSVLDADISVTRDFSGKYKPKLANLEKID